ncbi:acetyl-CoA carboxylase biotin carboxylase subunit [Clostridium folliculivorans]|uniref:Biotin carboxylase n=1 Tax=Clostridium folliculivorans TaxID=2886038 RepID=A0A9W5Y2T5_9CLOT|nr:acetyl-CoA carboxylase biotin carboxylase subunit [Clostridium folliculivorans]GKU25701.1 acetyl-CoA carboxylase biotin carboxylase subunit [Clostridium folliculivorans]GKU28723.1 acetyl-CoA carboxylase biotin carboxylase subunit [Clostridium folliculivorans]
MIRKILIANRGEIAVRIIRACREMGIETVAVYSEADRDSLHAQVADEAVCIGPAKSKDSYLNMGNIISAAVLTGAQAIHPGFGFLSENSVFARMCEECNIKFIGPSPSTIEMMGDKSKAREVMIDAGVPVVPGTEGIIETLEEAYNSAENIGYPVMVKASAGGGGKGIRIVHKREELDKAYETAKSEAKVNFGDDRIYMEKFIENPRHIEFQILGDEHGNIIHLGERDCSLQRRNQKVLEEAPSVVLDKDLRDRMGNAAVKAAKAVDYKNAGTIEFLLDKNGRFYFMEMNTRIQVEHPVTEMVTGIDLVKEQIKIAAGEKLSITQESLEIRGHAIECRINAENPHRNFAPSPGKIEFLFMPGGNGVRIDSAVYNGYVIPPHYDSMIAKLIVFGKTREEAIEKMKRALWEFTIDGIDNNIDFQLEILNHPKFIDGKFDTGFINKEIIK